jgi:glycine/D-amino acid oxidase-like deaminating enzyme
VAESLNRRSIVVLLSDLFCPRDDLFRGLQLLRQRGHEVIVLQILDDEELDFRFSGTMRFDGLESAGRLTCDPAALRTGYLAALEQFLDTIRRRCAGSRIDYRLIRTSDRLDAALAPILMQRMSRT